MVGQTASQTVGLAYAPNLIEEPQSQRTTIGGTAEFKVKSIGLTPMTYQWYKDGEIIKGATNYSLILTRIDENDFGSYYVKVKNSIGSDTSLRANLTLNNNKTVRQIGRAHV